MTGNLIATTSKDSMHALAFQGIMVYTCFPQIRDMLLRKFGDEYVLLFCNPVENTANGAIDWYSPVKGEALGLADLPEEKRKTVCAHVADMAAAIGNYAEELINSREPLRVTRGNILKLALRYPDDSAIYAVGGQPVITCWGFGPGTPGVEGKDLTKLMPAARAVPGPKPAAAPEPAPVPPPQTVLEREVAAAAGKGGWWWLLPVLPLLLLLLLLFAWIGDREALSGHTIFRVPAPAFLQAEKNNARLAELKSEIEALTAQLNEKARQCKPEPAASQSKPRQDMVIPEKARDTGFLEGHWLCETGLINARTNEPVKLEFSFDKSGSGTAITYEKAGNCSGPVRAQMLDGKLRIAVEEQTCPNSSYNYDPVLIECVPDAHYGASCTGINRDGTRWKAAFQAVK